MRQDAQKPARKFCTRKTAKKRKTHPIQPEKGETGCVLGAGEGCSRYGRVGKPEIRTKMHQIAMQHMKKENRRKPSVFAGFVAGAEGLEPSARGFGVDVETAHRERGRDKVAPFYQPSHKTGGAGLVLSEKTSGSSVLSAICHRMIASICDLYYNITKQDRLAYVERISCELLLRILRALPMFQRME